MCVRVCVCAYIHVRAQSHVSAFLRMLRTKGKKCWETMNEVVVSADDRVCCYRTILFHLPLQTLMSVKVQTEHAQVMVVSTWWDPTAVSVLQDTSSTASTGCVRVSYCLTSLHSAHMTNKLHVITQKKVP